MAKGVLEQAPTKTKSTNVPKRVFIHRLLEIYATHHPDASSYLPVIGTKRQLRAFVKTVLDFAGIDYPNPETHTDRFDDLLDVKHIY